MKPVALVTGGGTGIGASIARRLARDGHSVAVTGRRQEPVERLAAELGGLAVAGDTGSVEDAERAVGETVGRFGGLNVLVCNAGIGGEGTVRELTPAAWDDVVRTNLTGAFLMARAAIEHLLRGVARSSRSPRPPVCEQAPGRSRTAPRRRGCRC